MLRSLLLGIIASSTLLLHSCEGDYSIEYHWVDMNAVNATSSSEYPERSYADSIQANNYVLQLILEVEELSRQGRYLDTELAPRNVNYVDTIIITSSQDFDANHLAGSNLTDLFLAFTNSYYHTFPADGSEGYNITNRFSLDYYNNPNPNKLNLILIHPPTISQTHSFQVQFVLQDGTTFTSTSAQVTLY